MTNRTSHAVAALTLLAMAGCGGGGGGGGQEGASRLTARISTPASVIDERTQARLDGTGSRGTIASYSWSVLDNDKVRAEIVDANQAIATLRVGEATASTPITVRLTVTSSNAGTATTEQQLTVTELDEARLPPDPGDNSRATVEGVDANGNKVRDEVERAIYQRHKDSIEDRSVMMVVASTLQDAIVSGVPGSSANKDIVADNVSRGIDCLFKRPSLKPRQSLAVIKSLVIDTPDRLAAYRQYDQSRNGTVQQPAVAPIELCMTYAK